jgi:hypothetical protein
VPIPPSYTQTGFTQTQLLTDDKIFGNFLNAVVISTILLKVGMRKDQKCGFENWRGCNHATISIDFVNIKQSKKWYIKAQNPQRRTTKVFYPMYIDLCNPVVTSYYFGLVLNSLCFSLSARPSGCFGVFCSARCTFPSPPRPV